MGMKWQSRRRRNAQRNRERHWEDTGSDTGRTRKCAKIKSTLDHAGTPSHESSSGASPEHMDEVAVKVRFSFLLAPAHKKRRSMDAEEELMPVDADHGASLVIDIEEVKA
eukprot:Sspe_Gene.115561::Locus_103156_Transcript_1_2_Confidence_1.000_Length_329::g.115561::m.115561